MLKNIIIFFAVFLTVLWLQHNDDLRFKNSKKRTNLYDMIKIPLFVSVVVLLLKDIDYGQCFNEIQAVFIVPDQIKNITPTNDVFNDIFTEQPDF